MILLNKGSENCLLKYKFLRRINMNIVSSKNNKKIKVVTYQQIAKAFECEERAVRDNFSNNKKGLLKKKIILLM